MLEKPSSKADLEPPFDSVGAQGWQTALRRLFADFGVPPVDPIGAREIEEAEVRLGLGLPDDWKQILLEFGALSVGYSSWVSPKKIVRLDTLWFREFLTQNDRNSLASMLLVATTGSDNCYCYDPASGLVHLCSHDPAGVFERIPSVGDLLRFELLSLHCGYYGWPDDEVSAMVEEVRELWLGKWSRAD